MAISRSISSFCLRHLHHMRMFRTFHHCWQTIYTEMGKWVEGQLDCSSMKCAIDFDQTPLCIHFRIALLQAYSKYILWQYDWLDDTVYILYFGCKTWFKTYHGVNGPISSFVSDTQNILTIFYENNLYITVDDPLMFPYSISYCLCVNCQVILRSFANCDQIHLCSQLCLSCFGFLFYINYNSKNIIASMGQFPHLISEHVGGFLKVIHNIELTHPGDW